MKSRYVLTALAVATGLACLPGYAEDAPKTRAEVKKEYLDARKAGTVPNTVEGAEKPMPRTKSDKTRADVKSEYQSARKSGDLPITTDGVSKPLPKGSNVPRAEVREEGKKAARQPNKYDKE